MIADKVNESHKIGYYRLCALSLDKINDIVVCGRVILYKYLSDDTYSRLFNIKRGDSIKVRNNRLYILVELS